MTNAWGLHRAWPEARFEIILDAGHASIEPGIIDALVRATDSFRDRSRTQEQYAGER
jgi:proline iminopeptidase